MHRVFRRGMILLGCVLLDFLPLWGFGAAEGMAPADFSEYSLSVTLNARMNRLECVETIRFKNVFPDSMDEFWLYVNNRDQLRNPFVSDLHNDAGFPEGRDIQLIRILSIRDRISELPLADVDISKFRPWLQWSTANSLLRVALVRPVLPNALGELTIVFQVPFPNRSTMAERWRFRESLGLRLGWYPVEVARDYSQWQLSLDQLMAHRISGLKLAVPDMYQVAIAGDRVSERLENGFRQLTVSWAHPVRSVPVQLSRRFQKSIVRQVQGCQLEMRVMNDVVPEIPVRMLTDAADIVASFNAWLYPLPDKRLVIAHSAQRFSGAQVADGMVVIGHYNFVPPEWILPHALDRVTTFFMAHELAHQWIGVATAADFGSENYLVEGLADYLAAWYFNRKYPGLGNLIAPESENLPFVISELALAACLDTPLPTTLDAMLNARVDQLRIADWDGALYDAARSGVLNGRSVREREKAGRVFRMLQYKLGESVWMSLLSRILRENQYGFLTTDKLELSLVREGGAQCARFVTEWIRQPGWQDVAVAQVKTAKQAGADIQHVRILRFGTAETPVSVQTKDAGSIFYVERIERPTDNMQFEVSLRAPLSEVAADPGHELLDSDRKNNVWPRKTEVVVFPNWPHLKSRLTSEVQVFDVWPAPFAPLVTGGYMWGMPRDFPVGLLVSTTDYGYYRGYGGVAVNGSWMTGGRLGSSSGVRLTGHGEYLNHELAWRGDACVPVYGDVHIGYERPLRRAAWQVVGTLSQGFWIGPFTGVTHVRAERPAVLGGLAVTFDDVLKSGLRSDMGLAMSLTSESPRGIVLSGAGEAWVKAGSAVYVCPSFRYGLASESIELDSLFAASLTRSGVMTPGSGRRVISVSVDVMASLMEGRQIPVLGSGFDLVSGVAGSVFGEVVFRDSDLHMRLGGEGCVWFLNAGELPAALTAGVVMDFAGFGPGSLMFYIQPGRLLSFFTQNLGY